MSAVESQRRCGQCAHWFIDPDTSTQEEVRASDKEAAADLREAANELVDPRLREKVFDKAAKIGTPAAYGRRFCEGFVFGQPNPGYGCRSGSPCRNPDKFTPRN